MFSIPPVYLNHKHNLMEATLQLKVSITVCINFGVRRLDIEEVATESGFSIVFLCWHNRCFVDVLVMSLALQLRTSDGYVI